jgi:hypothetical protein
MSESDTEPIVDLRFEDFAAEEIVKNNPRFNADQLNVLFNTFVTFKDRNSEYLNMERLLTCMEMFKDDGRKEIKMRLLENLGERYPRGTHFSITQHQPTIPPQKFVKISITYKFWSQNTKCINCHSQDPKDTSPIGYGFWCKF